MTRNFKPFYHQAYLDKGVGPVVVILHAPFGNLRMWRHLVTGLKDNYRVVVPRLPIFGLPVKNTSIKELSEILFEFLDWHQLTDVTLIGHGIGGQVALRHAHDFPDLTRNVVITGTSNVVLKDVIENDPETQDYEEVTRIIRKAFYDERKVTHGIVDSVFEVLHDSTHRQSIFQFLENNEENSINQLLLKIRQPVLLAWGLHDRITPPEIAIHLNDHLPNGEVRFISNSGHLPMIEESEQYLSTVGDFLKSH